MVSFFGLKIGGKSKVHTKQHHNASKQLPRSGQELRRENSGTPSSEHSFGSKSNNFSRPGFHLPRPDTSASNRDNSTLWRAPYMGGPVAASSMVDLAPPRTPIAGNMRHNSSDVNLGTRFNNGSSGSLVKPAPLGSGNGGSRPATPTRPGTATRKEDNNPINVHFGKDSVSSSPGTPLADMLPKRSLDQFEFGLGANAHDAADSDNPNANGYPSPPPSINSTERPSSSRRNQPSALRNVEAVGPMSLPSPAASVARTSEEVWEIPVIRNVQAKRDTLTFHTPRRQSMNMEVEEAAAREAREKPKEAEPAKKPVAEGFVGNFAGFDFGESVRRASVGFRSPDMGTSDKDMSPADARKPGQTWERAQSPLGGGRKPSPTDDEKRLERPRNLSDPIAPPSITSSTVRQPSPLVQQVPFEEQHEERKPTTMLRPSAPSAPSAPPSAPPAALPSAPSAAQLPVPVPASVSAPLPTSLSAPLLGRSQHQLPPAPAPAPIPLSLLAPQAPPPTTSLPPPPSMSNPRHGGPPSAAVGVRAPVSQNTYPGARPGYINRPLDPPPRGFRPRLGSDPRARPPPTGLRVPPPLTDRKARSPYGPPPEEGSYMRSEPSPRPPQPPQPLHEGLQPRAQSPFTSARLPEGDFPVSKGLPRGRPPPRVDSIQDGPYGLSPRIPPRQRPAYPPQKPEPSPTSTSMHSEEESAAPNHRYTLPNWDDFDRADPHRSAIPAPLSPFHAQHPPLSPMRPPRSPPADSPTSPRWPLHSNTSSPISPTPPSLPSPSFPSLEHSISSSSETFARTFEMSYDPPAKKPLISPVMIAPEKSPNSKRVQAKRAPPRPTPITLAPSKPSNDVIVRTPVADEFGPNFI